jgi:hypothetical protein
MIFQWLTLTKPSLAERKTNEQDVEGRSDHSVPMSILIYLKTS